ncbi:MAG: BACON domain-containing protein [Candidatus Cryptobacteroides sp.]
MKKYLTIAALAALVGIASCEKPVEKIDISASPATVTFEGDGGTINVAVTTSSETFTVETGADWLTYEVNGKEIALTATNNNTKAERSATVTLTDDHSSCKIEVAQQIGSPVAGYKALASASMDYAGTMMYMFSKPLTEDYGGMAFLTLTDMDGNILELLIYTPLYLTAEEVELPEGEYTAGKDKLLEFYAVPLTWVPGTSMSLGSDEDEEATFGSVFKSITEQTSFLVSGKLNIKDGIITVDMKDAEGNEYKYAYDGEVEIITENASYPSDAEDPTQNIFQITCSYNGLNEAGALSMTLMIFAGEDRMNPNISMFNFYMPAAEFSETMDLSGEYMPAETDADKGKAGTVDLGYMVDLGGFSFPMGSSIIFNNGDMWAADGLATLILTKTESGEYSIMASMADSTFTTMYLFMPQTTFPIYLEDASQGVD